MSSTFEYNEKQFDEIADFGDNTDRVLLTMMNPTLGSTSMMRYKPAAGNTGKVNCMAISCDFEKLLLSGAYTTAQAGWPAKAARVRTAEQGKAGEHWLPRWARAWRRWRRRRGIRFI